MGYIAKYATVVIKDGSSVIIKQFIDTTEALLYYRSSIANGKDAYYYFGPRRRKSAFDNPAPIEVTF
jgi:hypothetical protein